MLSNSNPAFSDASFASNVVVPFGPIGIISHSANKEFVKKVSNVLFEKRTKRTLNRTTSAISTSGYLRSDYILDADLVRFQTGEGKIQLEETVRGHDIFIITDVLSHSESFPIFGYEHTISPDDQYRDLLRIVNVCVKKARRVNVIMPFLYEGLQDHRINMRESLDCSACLQQLYEYGVSNIIIFDPHDGRIDNSVPLMGLDKPSSAYKIISTVLHDFDSIKLDNNQTMVVSPDETGINRAVFYSSVLKLQLGIFYKDRDYSKQVNGEYRIKDYRYIGESVEGKDILLIDDMINSGDTMLSTAAKLKKLGAKDVYCLAPFGLFTSGLEVFDKAYEEGTIKACVCTNLIYRSPELLAREWYRDADMVPYIARIIDAINVDESITDIISSTTKLTEFLDQMRIGEVFDKF